jgi:hypothetical protein
MSQLNVYEVTCEVHVVDRARPDDFDAATICGEPAEMALHLGFPVCDEHQSDAWEVFLRGGHLYARPRE